VDCTHNQFPTLAPATIDELAGRFDAETLTAMHHDLAPIIAAGGPTAAAWQIVLASLTEAHEVRVFMENPHLVGHRDRP
jgi:hypothetical protein